MMRFLALAATLALSLSASAAFAQEVKAGDLTIVTPWARATPKGAEVGVGYLEIRNAGGGSDRLTGGASDFANVEVHDMKMENGVMKMREVTDGLEIPAHGSVKLAPSGYHLMFTDLKRPLVSGETVTATLNFEHAGSVKVDFSVQPIGAAAPKSDDMNKSGAMKGMKM